MDSHIEFSEQLIAAERHRGGLRERVTAGIAWRTVLRHALLLAFVIGSSLLLLTALYRWPLTVVQELGTYADRVPGLEDPESNGIFSYAYTKGDAAITFPRLGNGPVMLSLRAGGPNAAAALPARVKGPTTQVEIGPVQQIRVYYLLLPATGAADLHFRLESATTQVPPDIRNLGVLLDWAKVQSFGGGQLPPSAALPIAIALLGALLITLPISPLLLGKLPLLLIDAIVVALAYAACRGRVATDPVWMIGMALCFTVLTRPVFLWGRRWLKGSIATHTAPSRATGRLQGYGSRLTVRITALFIAWRLALWLVAAVSIWNSGTALSIGEGIYGVEGWRRGDVIDGAQQWQQGTIVERGRLVQHMLVDGWVHWDGKRYAGIARDGYESFEVLQPNIAFFPLYPLLTRLGMLSGVRAEVAGLVVAQLALWLALLLLYDLVARDLGERAAIWAALALLLFPTAVFLGAMYTESLALLWAIATLWALRRRQWWLAGVAGGLLALTRLPGVLMAPVIALVYLHQQRWQWRRFSADVYAASLPLVGLALFMLYQWVRWRMPTAFFMAQDDWHNQLSPPWTIPLTALAELGTATHWPAALFVLSAWVLSTGLIVLAVRRLPLAYGLTLLALLLPAYLSSFLYSFARYMLVGFPLFIVLGLLAQRRWLRFIVIGVMAPLLVVATVLLVNGFWVG